MKFSIAITALFVSNATAFAPSIVSGRIAPQQHMTVLHMNLFDRFSRVAKGTLNDVLKGLEDPEKIMNQALEDMQVRKRKDAVCVFTDT